MFRIKVKIDPTFLKNQSFRFSSGTPGIAHIRLDEKTPWPDELKIVSNVQ
jgi:HlyD family secretion protein